MAVDRACRPRGETAAGFVTNRSETAGAPSLGRSGRLRVAGVDRTAAVPAPHAAGATSPGSDDSSSDDEPDRDGPTTLRALCQEAISSASPPNR